MNSTRHNEGCSSVDRIDDIVHHLPSVLSSFASMLLYLPDIEDSYIDQLESLIGTFFIIYPQLYHE